ncbi:hypothetical protein [Ottowia sp. VDI28]|uniref:hypothetical protein n=1 Tax=Ottowia sp. VDI28 TaxID=3133968 RepID=UPI003C2E9813
MTTQNNALQMDQDEPQPLDLHGLYNLQTEEGYDRCVTLPPFVAQSLAMHLRGIDAVVSVLSAARDTEALKLSDWMSGGLIDAVDALSSGARDILYQAAQRARKGDTA